MTQTPRGNNPVRPQTPVGGNQQVPQAAGNPRYQSGLGPDPNPKVVVKSVNPPITPDQVVSLAEQPSSAIELPNIKLQNIKIPPVKNKTIQGHLKAIEAKMIATEKLMKDVVKLQRLQIQTEKEIYERKRELYQNTFEEYIYDKTIDFEDPDDPDCTCINLPTGPKGPRGGNRGGGGGVGVPVPLPIPGRTRQEQANEPANEPITSTPPVVVPTPPKSDDPANDIKEGPKVKPQTEPVEPPAVPVPSFNPFDLIKIIPWIFGPLLPGNPAYQAQSTGPNASSNPIDGFFRNLVDNNDTLLAVEKAMQEEAAAKAAAPAKPPFNLFSPDTFVSAYTDPNNLIQAFGLMQGMDQMEGGALSDILLKSRIGVGMASRMTPALSNFKTNINLKNPFRRRNMDINDPAFDFDLATMEAAGYTSPQLRSTLIKDGVDMPTTVRELQPGVTVIQRGPINADKAMALHRKTDTLKQGEEALTTLGQQSIDDLNNLKKSTPKQASGGMGSMDLYNSGAKQYFRKISNDMNIPKFGGGGFNLLNPMSWFRGDLKKVQEGELENVSNDTFAGKLYNRRKQQEEMMRKLRGYQSGGIVDWWNMGRNARVPAENSASWRTLMADDAKQITRSNKAFRSGATGIRGWNPIKAFTPEMVRTGPTPAVRQAFERPVRFVRDQIVRSAVSSVVKPMIRPLLKPLVAASGLILATPSPAGGALYGPGAVDPKYRNVTSREEFDKLEAAQNSMMSGSDNQQPQVMPLPPDYIKIPGKTPPKQMDTFVVPGIDKPNSMFTRSTTFID